MGAIIAPLLTLKGFGTILTVVGQLQQASAAAAQAESAQAMMEYNAKLAEREAEQERMRSLFEQGRQAEEGARVMGTMRAGMGAAGVVSTEGTPLLVQAKQASELELKNLMIGYEGAESAQRYRSQAVLDRIQAKIYGQKAGAYRTGGYLNAGTTLLKGFA